MLPSNQRNANMAASGMPGGGFAGQKLDKDQAKAAVQNHINQKVLVVDDMDRQVWMLVSNVPYVTKPIAAISAFLNLILPGFGTILAACMADQNVSKTQMFVGLLQFLTSWILIGWICAIYWGYLICTKAWDMNPMNMRNPAMSVNQMGYGYND